MTYTPVLPQSGYAGWALLNRTKAVQTAAFNKSPEIIRDADYFKANITKAKTADDLVSDRRLLRVALGAFGLDDDINNKAFIRKVLEGGTTASTALANKLSDKRYSNLAKAFGFDQTTPGTQTTAFAEEIIKKFQDKQFEIAVGESDQNLRLALNAQTEVSEMASASGSDATKWYRVIGNSALSTVFQKALNLPTSVASLDVDQQLDVYMSKAKDVFGDSGFAQFADSGTMDSLIKKFLTRAQAEELISQSSSNSIALQLMQSMRRS